MNLVKPTTIEGVVINALAENASSGTVLLEKARENKKTLTKQALYVVLRKLIAEEIIVKHGTQFSLSNVWLGKMYEFFLVARERYGARHETVDFLSLTDGDKIAYNFKSPAEADKFWAHAFDVLARTMSFTEPIYLYNPHEWFILVREESERGLFEKLRSQKRNLWLTAGNSTLLDLSVRKFFDGTYLQYHALEKPLFEKNSRYINIFGDFIIEATLDQETADAIDVYYKDTVEWNEGAKIKLTNIVSKGKTKLIISRSERKAVQLKKVLGVHFFKTKNSAAGTE